MTSVKFKFECQKCGKCCEERGPIPLVINDLIMWAKSDVIANIFPYLQFIKTPMNTLDLVLKYGANNPVDPQKQDENVIKCPLYNNETKECTIYQYRPLSCRTYPLEFNGKDFQIVDADDPGLGKGDMTKEQLFDFKDLAKKMNQELIQMRISMPIIAQAMQPFVIKELIDAQRRIIEEMDPEEKAKIEEEMNKIKSKNE